MTLVNKKLKVSVTYTTYTHRHACACMYAHTQIPYKEVIQNSIVFLRYVASVLVCIYTECKFKSHTMKQVKNKEYKCQCLRGSDSEGGA